MRCRFSPCEDHSAGAAGRRALFEGQMAQRALGGSAMNMMMPDHAERRHYHEDDQHDCNYHTPGSRLVRHLESAQKRFAVRQSSLF